MFVVAMMRIHNEVHFVLFKIHDMRMNTQLNEVMRILRNLIRTGIVTDVDLDEGLCRVQTGGIETTWLNGIKGSMAGTGASAIFNRLQAPMGKAVEAISELGVKTRDSKGNMLPVEKILKAIHKSFEKNKLGTAEQGEYLKVIFGEEAMKGAIKLVAAAGDGSLDKKRQTIRDSKGSTELIAKIQTDNLDGDVKNLQSAWENLQIEVFDKENSALRRLTVSATEWIGKVSAWANANPQLTQTLFSLVSGGLALIGVLGGIGLIAWPVITGINAIITAAGFLGTTLAAMGTAIVSVLGAITWPVVALN